MPWPGGVSRSTGSGRPAVVPHSTDITIEAARVPHVLAQFDAAAEETICSLLAIGALIQRQDGTPLLDNPLLRESILLLRNAQRSLRGQSPLPADTAFQPVAPAEYVAVAIKTVA